jgi:hypothetical protein
MKEYNTYYCGYHTLAYRISSALQNYETHVLYSFLAYRSRYRLSYGFGLAFLFLIRASIISAIVIYSFLSYGLGLAYSFFFLLPTNPLVFPSACRRLSSHFLILCSGSPHLWISSWIVASSAYGHSLWLTYQASRMARAASGIL